MHGFARAAPVAEWSKTLIIGQNIKGPTCICNKKSPTHPRLCWQVYFYIGNTRHYFFFFLFFSQTKLVIQNYSCVYFNSFVSPNIFSADCAAAYQQGYRNKYIVVIQPHQNLAEFKVECHLHEGPVTRILIREQNKTNYFVNRKWYSFM